MPKVKVYTTDHCPYCVAAKKLLSSKGMDYEEINLEGQWDQLDALKKETGLRTVPQIFFDEKLIGGYTELAEMAKNGDLD